MAFTSLIFPTVGVGSLQCDIKESAPTTSRDLIVTFLESVNIVMKQFHCLLFNSCFTFC